MTTATATATIVRQPLHSLCLFSPPADDGPSEAPGSKDSQYQQQQQQQQYGEAHEQAMHSQTPALSTSATTTASIASTASTASSSDSSKRSSSHNHHHQQQQPIDSLESWPMAVEALAQRLWDCGRDAFGRHCPSSLSLSSSSYVLSSKLVFDDEADDGSSANNNNNSINSSSSSSPNSVICDAPICQDDVAADSLCDGPYVKIDYAQPELGPSAVTVTAVAAAAAAVAACSPSANSSAAAAHETAIRQQRGADDHADDHISGSPQSPTQNKNKKWQKQLLCQNQPMTNPFKTMMLRQMPPSCTTAGSQPHQESSPGVSVHQRPGYMRTPYRTAAPTPRLAAATSPPSSACVHCKKGNFLEFCFVNDRCRCACHAECPCKPCIDIREQRLNQKASFTVISAATAHASAVSTPTKRSHNDYFVKHHSPHAAKAARVWNENSQKQQQQQQHQPQQHGLCSLAS